MKKCQQCGKEFKPNDYRTRFCSRNCSAKFNNSKRIKNYYCEECNKKLDRWGSRFCSRQCLYAFRKKKYIEDWKNGKKSGGYWCGVADHVRLWLVSLHGEICWVCGWGEKNRLTGRVPLQVNHIDGNPLNHRPENLELLCPNCHSLTETFGGLNRGKGRSQRYQ